MQPTADARVMHFGIPALGAKFEVEQSTARHLVLDLCWIQGIEPGSSRIIQSADVHLEFPSFATADAVVNQAKGPKPDPNCPACLGRKDAKHIATCPKSRSPPDPDSGGVDLPQGSGPGQEPSSSSIQRQAPAQRITGKTTLQPGQARQQKPRAEEAEQLEPRQPAVEPPPDPEPQPEGPTAGGIPPALAKTTSQEAGTLSCTSSM